MITTARVPSDKSVQIAFSLNDSTELNDPDNSFPLAFPDLDQQLQPLPPCHASMESVQVFKDHCKMAKEFCDVKKEMALLEERKKKLMAELDDDEKENLDAARLEREFRELAEENQTLISCHNHYSEQLEILRVQNQKRQGSS